MYDPTYGGIIIVTWFQELRDGYFIVITLRYFVYWIYYLGQLVMYTEFWILYK
jgi:hypothetical protein